MATNTVEFGKIVVLMKDGTRGGSFGITKDITFGRGKGSDIRIKLSSVSREQAKIVLDQNGMTNPTQINGIEVSSLVNLQNGDEIGIGERKFIFEATAPTTTFTLGNTNTAASYKHVPNLETIDESVTLDFNVSSQMKGKAPKPILGETSNIPMASIPEDAPSSPVPPAAPVAALTTPMKKAIQSRRKSTPEPQGTTPKSAPRNVTAHRKSLTANLQRLDALEGENNTKKMNASLKRAIEQRRKSITSDLASLQEHPIDEATQQTEVAKPMHASLLAAIQARRRKSGAHEIETSVAQPTFVPLHDAKSLSTPMKRAIQSRRKSLRVSEETMTPAKASKEETVTAMRKVSTPLRKAIQAKRRSTEGDIAKLDCLLATSDNTDEARRKIATPLRNAIKARRQSLQKDIRQLDSIEHPEIDLQADVPRRTLFTPLRNDIAARRKSINNDVARSPATTEIDNEDMDVVDTTLVDEEVQHDELIIAVDDEDAAVETTINSTRNRASLDGYMQSLQRDGLDEDAAAEQALDGFLNQLPSSPAPTRRRRQSLLASLEKKGTKSSSADIDDIMGSISDAELEIIDQYTQELLAVVDMDDNEAYAMCMDAYIRGTEMASQHKEINNVEFIEDAVIPTTSTRLSDRELVLQYAEELSRVSCLSADVAYGVALDSYLADPEAFRQHIVPDDGKVFPIEHAMEQAQEVYDMDEIEEEKLVTQQQMDIPKTPSSSRKRRERRKLLATTPAAAPAPNMEPAAPAMVTVASPVTPKKSPLSAPPSTHKSTGRRLSICSDQEYEDEEDMYEYEGDLSMDERLSNDGPSTPIVFCGKHTYFADTSMESSALVEATPNFIKSASAKKSSAKRRHSMFSLTIAEGVNLFDEAMENGDVIVPATQTPTTIEQEITIADEQHEEDGGVDNANESTESEIVENEVVTPQAKAKTPRKSTGRRSTVKSARKSIMSSMEIVDDATVPPAAEHVEEAKEDEIRQCNTPAVRRSRRSTKPFSPVTEEVVKPDETAVTTELVDDKNDLPVEMEVQQEIVAMEVIEPAVQHTEESGLTTEGSNDNLENEVVTPQAKAKTPRKSTGRRSTVKSARKSIMSSMEIVEDVSVPPAAENVEEAKEDEIRQCNTPAVRRSRRSTKPSSLVAEEVVQPDETIVPAAEFVEEAKEDEIRQCNTPAVTRSTRRSTRTAPAVEHEESELNASSTTIAENVAEEKEDEIRLCNTPAVTRATRRSTKPSAAKDNEVNPTIGSSETDSGDVREVVEEESSTPAPRSTRRTAAASASKVEAAVESIQAVEQTPAMRTRRTRAATTTSPDEESAIVSSTARKTRAAANAVATPARSTRKTRSVVTEEQPSEIEPDVHASPVAVSTRKTRLAEAEVSSEVKPATRKARKAEAVTEESVEETVEVKTSRSSKRKVEVVVEVEVEAPLTRNRRGKPAKDTAKPKKAKKEVVEECDEVKEDEEVALAILCDGCDSEHFLDELGMESIPEGDWYCPSCVKKQEEKPKKGKTSKRKVEEPPVTRATRSRRG